MFSPIAGRMSSVNASSARRISSRISFRFQESALHSFQSFQPLQSIKFWFLLYHTVQNDKINRKKKKGGGIFSSPPVCYMMNGLFSLSRPLFHQSQRLGIVHRGSDLTKHLVILLGLLRPAIHTIAQSVAAHHIRSLNRFIHLHMNRGLLRHRPKVFHHIMISNRDAENPPIFQS